MSSMNGHNTHYIRKGQSYIVQSSHKERRENIMELNRKNESVHAPSFLGQVAYNSVFCEGRLTFGFIMPLESYPDSPFPTLEDHTRLARFADQSGFSALWMRDVPFYDPTFGDAGQMLDPFVYMGYLAAHTRTIALGTAGIVLPLRDPIGVAKQAVSVDQLTQGRLLLGLSSGDRPAEYPAFGADFENRGERFRDGFSLIRNVTSTNFPTFETDFYGEMDGQLDLIPKPVHGSIPMLVVGRGRQSMEWLANNTDGWMSHLADFRSIPEIVRQWRAANHSGIFRPFAYGSFFELAENPDEPLSYLGNRHRMGRKALLHHWKIQEAAGVNHIALNLKPSRRPVIDILQELKEYILPHFPSCPRY